MDQFLRKNLWVINLLSLGLLAFFLASGTGAMLGMLFAPVQSGEEGAPVAISSRNKSRDTKRFTSRTGRDICVSNVFNFELRPCAEEYVEPEEDTDLEEEEEGGGVPPYCEESGSKLVATMVSTDPSWSFAMIKGENGTMPYRVGKSVPGLGTVQRVGWRLVLLDANTGPDCLLDLYPVKILPEEGSASNSPAPSATPTARKRVVGRGQLPADLQKRVETSIEVVSATERNVDKGLVDSLIENSTALMSQARILPYERDGAVQGFKLYGIRRNSLLGRLGLRNGDIVNSIGGIEMTSPDRALQAYTTLRNTQHLTLTFTRRGRRQTMDYNIR